LVDAGVPPSDPDPADLSLGQSAERGFAMTDAVLAARGEAVVVPPRGREAQSS
jgi:hypothetical protein